VVLQNAPRAARAAFVVAASDGIFQPREKKVFLVLFLQKKNKGRVVF
jgi:tellurite resistance protein